MASNTKNEKRSLFNAVTLFGGFFVLAGVFAFLMIAGPQLYGPVRTSGWQAVPAVAHDVSGQSRWHTSDGSSTRVYSLRVDYSYNYQGVDYRANTVTLDDGFDSDDDYWHALESRIRSEGARQQLQAWINPGQPAEAVLERGVRWSKVFFGFVFLGCFSGAGAGVIWLSRRQKSPSQRAIDGQKGIKPTGELAAKVFVFSGLMFILLSSPVFFSLSKELARGNYAVLVALLFPLVGLGFLVAGWKMRQKRLRFGPMLLMADPLPGCVGGQIGGSFELTADKGRDSLSVHIECARIRQGRGKNSSSSKSVVWQESTACYGERSANGSKHSFALDIPEGLPVTGSEGRTSVQWVVSVQGMLKQNNEMVEFSGSWEVPVVEGVRKSAVSVPLTFAEQVSVEKTAAPSAKAEAQIDIESSARSMRLTSESGRHGGSFAALLFMGSIFTVFGILAGVLFDDSGFGGWFFAVVFSSVGLLIMSASLWTWGRRLDVGIGSTKISVLRSLFGRALYQRTVQLTESSTLRLKSTSSSTVSGQRTKEYFALMISSTRGEQVLAEGIEGRLAAEALEQRVQGWLDNRINTADTTAELV